MAWWNKKQVHLDIPAPKPEELLSMVEGLAMRGLDHTINSTIEKMISDASQYQTHENADDQGNYFGNEFNIRATSGRIKATYSREPWVFAAATLIAKTLSTVPMKVYNKATGEEMPGHPLQLKINAGNRLADNLTINWCGVLDLILCGNFFRVFDAAYNEMMQVPADLVTLVLADDRKTIASIKIWNEQVGKYTISVPYKQVIHHKFPNPYNPYYGMSLFTACARPIILDRFKNEFEMAFYLRGATNAGVIETTEDINKSRMERLMRTFEQVYTGKRNWWRTIFLPKGAKWVQSGLSMTEMQHLEGLRENRLTILATLGIPPSKVGLVQDVNRSTSDNQDKDFWLNTIKPLAEFMAAGWNNSHLVKVIYPNIVVKPDMSHVEVLRSTMKQKGEEAKTVEGYMTINEIRKEILGISELPSTDARGNLFAVEVRPAQVQAGPVTDPLQALIDGIDAAEGAPEAAPAEAPQELSNALLVFKAQAVENQEQIERKLSTSYTEGFSKYVDELLSITEQALRSGQDVAKRLENSRKRLASVYINEVESTLVKALDRGFTFGNTQVKTLGSLGQVNKANFSPTDRQAIEALKAEEANGQRKTLVKRAIESFVGFNETRTKQVLDIITEGVSNGETLENIAATLRSQYNEAYKDQAFTITRTEVLTAISQGVKWNHDVLGKVFSKTQKQWFSVGDLGSNPDAREQHVDFENLGAVDSDYQWGGVLSYPRDPNGSASDNINCRCSMVTVIPDDAVSNADVILDSL
jgi:HK97 family phage portal protein